MHTFYDEQFVRGKSREGSRSRH